MGIEFIDGNITPEQVVIPTHMRSPELKSLKDGQSAFIPDWSVWMDAKGLVWADGSTPISRDIEADCVTDFVRVIQLPEGIVIDITTALPSFTDEDTGELDMQPQRFPEYVTEGYSYIKTPVIGLLLNPGEVELFGELVQARYGYEYPPATSIAPEN